MERGRGAARGVRAWLVVGAALAVLAPSAAAVAGQTGEVSEGHAVALGAGSAAPAAFQHPGVLNSRQSLEFARGKVDAGAQPWKTAFDRLRGDGLASMSRKAKPRATVECGPASKPNLGCSDERQDANAAYAQSLLWFMTRDAKHATKAIELMDAWSATIKGHTNHNAPLQTGWAGANWSRAGELIKHTYTGGWPQQARFATMLRTVYLPALLKGSGANGNWEMIMVDAAIGIAVHLDDKAAYDRAVTLWRGRVPAYVYLKSDGPTPRSAPGRPKSGAELVKYWYGQKSPTDGHAQETCRDLGHTGWGLEAAVHVAETAHIQGQDLYGEMRERMTKALEFHTRLDQGGSVPSSVCGGKISRGFGPVVEVAYNHYHNRTGVALPQTQKSVERGRPAGTSHFMGWETLTHAGNP